MYAIRSTRSLRQAQLVVFWLFPIFLVALLYRASQMIDWNEPGPIRHYFNVAEQYPALNQVAATVGVATGVALLAQFVGGTLLLWSGSRGRRAFVALSLLATYVGPVLYFSAPSLQGAIVSVVCVELAFGVLLARLLRSGASGVMREEPATRGWWGSFVATTVTVAALSVGMVAMGLWGGFLWTQGQDLEPNALVAVGVAALALIVFGWSLASFWTAPKPAPATM